MAEYIEREELCKRCGESLTKCGLCVAKDIPAADVVEVKRGRWEPQKEFDFVAGHAVVTGFCCSLCGLYYVDEHNLCPNCGAKMDLEE